MKILKFGGTSVGTPQRIQNLVQIVKNEESCIVVLSAMAGTTNALVEITEFLYKGDDENALQKIEDLEQDYISRVNELYTSDKYLTKGLELIDSHFIYIRNFVHKTFTQLQEKSVLAQGELISTAMFHYHLAENHVDSVLLPALNFMRIDKDGEPDSYYIQENLKREINQHPQSKLFITQGYICRNTYGEVDNLHRGGSDYSASLIGVAISAEEVQIWTDIDGFHNNDPRYVENTYAISELSFDEVPTLGSHGRALQGRHGFQLRQSLCHGIGIRFNPQCGSFIEAFRKIAVFRHKHRQTVRPRLKYRHGQSLA